MFRSTTTTALEHLRKAGHIARVPVEADPNSSEAGDTQEGHSLELIGPVPLPMAFAGRELAGHWYVAAPYGPDEPDSSPHISAVAFGNLASQPAPPLVRVHSTCFTGDVLGSLRCDCGPQLEAALEHMSESQTGGILIYMAAHEGRGIGLWSKAAAYLLQDEGLDTYEANRALGFPDDLRSFRLAAAVIRHLLDERPFRLLTNNPEKVKQLRSYGLHNVVQQPHVVGIGPRNRRYLNAKRDHGHSIPLASLRCHR